MKEMKQFKIRSFTKFYNFDRFQIVVRKRFRFKIIYCNGYKKLKDIDTSYIHKTGVSYFFHKRN